MHRKLLWTAHLLALTSVAGWALLDLRSQAIFQSLAVGDSSVMTKAQTLYQHAELARFLALGAVVLTAGSSVLLLVADRFRRNSPSASRSLASLLALATVAALWCGLAVNRKSLAWQGQRLQLLLDVEELETIARPLREDWPVQDGQLPRLGPFMAYPFGQPKTLVLLQTPSLLGERLRVAAVERSDQGAIKLQLTGTAHDDWAEWHPPGSQPRSFVGGLGDRHRLVAATEIGRGWHLVRYAPPPFQPRPTRPDPVA
ncbi:hypothetical protein [Roseimaritima sediminicola]|uniref:hypothetical protein n=1 Tax=Roseimaritima sediminicola TaxID=2662066 RepID=UPI00129857F8|nr:hypothetical protein [Roseimaritima sediminicola]